MDERMLRSRAQVWGEIRPLPSIAPIQRSRCRSLAHITWSCGCVASRLIALLPGGLRMSSPRFEYRFASVEHLRIDELPDLRLLN